MAYISALLLKRASHAKTSLDNAIVSYILLTMASMFGGAVLYYSDPSGTGIVEALGLNMIVMSVAIIAVLRYWTGSNIETNKPTIGKNQDELDLEITVIITRAYVVYFLVMMASMTTIGIVYVINTAITGLEEGLIAGNAIMMVGTVAILWYSLKHSGPKATLAGEGRDSTRSQLARATLILLVLSNEFLMGWSFILATGAPKIATGSSLQIAVSTFTSVGGSDWFLFTMALEMVLTIWMLRKMFSNKFVELVLFQSLLMFFVPTAIHNSWWIALSISIDICAMIALLTLAYKFLPKNRLADKGVARYILALLIFYSLVIAGLAVWITEGNSLLLLIFIFGAMILYFNTILAGNFAETAQSLSLTSKTRQPFWR